MPTQNEITWRDEDGHDNRLTVKRTTKGSLVLTHAITTSDWHFKRAIAVPPEQVSAFAAAVSDAAL